MLPAQVFFRPTTAFGTWIQRQKKVYDVGAGMGQLGAYWPKIVVGFDLHERADYLSPVGYGDGTDYPYDDNSVVLLARPSHGLWISQAFRNALEQGVSLYYCGLPRNFDDDLYGFDYELALTDAGQEGEQLLRITNTNEDFYAT